MTVYSILNGKNDLRKGSDDCVFNGYLEDYLGMEDSVSDKVLRAAFEKVFENYPETKICVGLKDSISRDAISNQIIRYKDVFKLAGKPLEFPYIMYRKEGVDERALLVVPYTDSSFITAKGLYYCMTEPGSELIDCKNEIVAVTSDKAEVIIEAFERMFKMKAGALQRSLDGKFFRNYDELKEKSLAAAEALKREAETVLPSLQDRGPVIGKFVIGWFLLKKVLYVQYMVNKSLLNSVHEGSVRKQRNQAKLNADSITFYSYSEMWNLTAPAEAE